MKNKHFIELVIVSLLVSTFLGNGPLPSRAMELSPPVRALVETDYPYPSGSTFVPLGSAQGAPGNPIPLREVYETLFHRVYDDGWNERATWTASAVDVDGTTCAPGTVIAPIPSSDYAYVETSSAVEVPRSFALQPIRIGLFYSSVRDEFDQVVTWEEGNWEQLFRVYLWSERYFETLTETQILNGDLAGYDMLILPSIRIGYADQVAATLGPEGLTALREWVEGGGVLYAQGEANALVEQAGLVPAGTIDVGTRVIDADNVATLEIAAGDHPLTFSWLDNTTYVLNEPLIASEASLAVVARYADLPGNTSQPGSAAIAVAHHGRGKAILVSGHPSDKLETLPQALDAVLWTMSRRAGLWGSLRQGYAATAPADVIPAYVAEVPITVTVTLADYWDNAMQNVVITETVSEGFVVDVSSVVSGGIVTANPDRTTTIVWHLETAEPGDTDLVYVVHTEEDTMASGSRLVSTGEATYHDPNENGAPFDLARKPLYIHARMAARLEGDRDIELDAIYPLESEGAFFDMALSLENKEETRATGVTVVDVVPLISPIVDVHDQRVVPHVLTDSVTYREAPTGTVWARNEVFFYAGMPYPLPVVNGLPATVDSTYSLDEWDHTTVYTFTGPFTTTPGTSNSVAIPITYSEQITLSAGGDLILPALVMTWTLGDMAAYDWAEPILRYGLFSVELFSRTVSFASDPVTPSLVLAASGGSVYAALGGDPIPYHEYVAHGVTHKPVPPTMPRVAYKDLWGREMSTTLRTSFYDIAPFPLPEEHAAVNTTFQLLADLDGDGTYADTPLDYPARNGALLRLMVKTRNNYETLDFAEDETLLRVGMFKGLGIAIEPAHHRWEDSWSAPQPGTTLITHTAEIPGYTFLFYNQELPRDSTRTLFITAAMAACGGAHKEGTIKLHDGVRYVYHQIAAGPSRYEVYDSHPQATFGIENDIVVDKHVAPVLVAAYDDTIYHFIEIADPWDPRPFSAEPYLRSYGFGDSAATTYVGGSEGRRLLSPRLNPGEQTRVRVELNNNTGQTWRDVAITPHAPPGITVTAIWTDESAMPPVFYDLPFLHAETITDAWHGVYYYQVDVDSGFALPRGEVYSVTFEVAGTGAPVDFQVPPALLGIEDENGEVTHVLGRSVDLVLSDLVPGSIEPQAARWGTEAQKEALVHAILSDTTPSQAEIDTAFNTMAALPMTTTVLSDGSEVHLDMDGKTLPWRVGDVEHGLMYAVLRSHSTMFASGTRIADYGPVLTYTDTFDQDWVAAGPERTVEVHGAHVTAAYHVDEITAQGDDMPLNGITPEALNVVDARVSLYNQGDYIASLSVVTMELASNVTISDARYSYVQAGPVVTFTFSEVRDLAPGDSEELAITLVVTPAGYGGQVATGSGHASPALTNFVPAPPQGYTRVIVSTWGTFNSGYSPLASTGEVTVTRLLLGPLDIGPAHSKTWVYLPFVARGYENWWPQALP